MLLVNEFMLVDPCLPKATNWPRLLRIRFTDASKWTVSPLNFTSTFLPIVFVYLCPEIAGILIPFPYPLHKIISVLLFKFIRPRFNKPVKTDTTAHKKHGTKGMLPVFIMTPILEPLKYKLRLPLRQPARLIRC